MAVNSERALPIPFNAPSMRYLIVVLMALIAAYALTLPAQAAARESEYVRYTVQPGDTLAGLANKYFTTSSAYRQVQRINGIANPRRMPVGKVLRIPRDVLKTTPARLAVASTSGPVQIRSSSGVRDAKVGETIRRGDQLLTGRGGFLSLQGAEGSRVTIPSQSHVKVLSAHRILLTDALDVEFDIVKGRGAFAPPKLNANGRYRVRTPVAVSAVRGTVFRVSFDENGERSTAEVVEGEVELTAGGTEKAIPQGFGTSANAAGVAEVEALLPAPAFEDGSAIQTGETLKFTLDEVAGAVAYRVEIARDPGFVDLVSDAVVDGTELELDGLDNGRYNVRSRAISESGLEGFSSGGDNFRRQRLGVAASAEASPLADGFKFAWFPAGEGELRYDFQLWKEGETSPPMINEIGLDKHSITLTNLQPATYFWRVAVVKPDSEEGLLRVWGETQKLVVAN